MGELFAPAKRHGASEGSGQSIRKSQQLAKRTAALGTQTKIVER